MLRRRRDRRSVSPKRNQKYSGDDGRTRGSSVEGRRTKTTSSLSHKSGTSPPPPTARRMLFGRNKNKPKQDHSPPPPSLIHRNHASPKISLKPKPRMQSPMAMYTSSPSVRTNSSSSRSRLVDDKFNSSLGLLYHSEDDDDDSFGHNNDSDEFSQEIQSVSSMGDAAKDDNDFLDSPSSIKQKESLDAVSDIEKLAQKSGTNTADERFRIMPDYAYPNLKLNRQELRIEMNKPSAYYHDLRQPSQYPNEVGILSLEILQCFGIPRNDVLKETSAFAIAVCGSQAFRTDVMPQTGNPMWLAKMRRACKFGVYQAYQRLYVGVFAHQTSATTRDGFAGRIVLDLCRLRPGSLYDVTLPLRESAHVYQKTQRGAIRIRVHLEYKNEQKAVLSYLPSSLPKLTKFQPHDQITVECTDIKAFQNVARAVHGNDMPGRFSMTLVKATLREVNYQRILLTRHLRKREIRDTMFWKTPVLSAFLFTSWMHSVWIGSVRYIPGHVITFLLLHMLKNYGRYHIDGKYDNGFLAPTWEELFMALWKGGKASSTGQSSKQYYIQPLEMQRKEADTVRSAGEFFGNAGGGHHHHQPTLIDMCNDLQENIPLVQNKWYYVRTYKDAFVAKKAVSFLVEQGYAKNRKEAVQIGLKMQNKLKLFDHIHRSKSFSDSDDIFRFLDFDRSNFIMRTHKAMGKGLMRILGFRNPPNLTVAQAHTEFAFASGDTHPKFLVKESLVIRSKESKNLIQAQHATQHADETDLGVSKWKVNQPNNHKKSSSVASTDGTQSMTASQGGPLSQGYSKGQADSDKDDNSVQDSLDSYHLDQHDSDDDSVEGVVVEDDQYELKVLSPPPNQDLGISKKSDKKMPDVLLDSREKMHKNFLHLFNDKVYKLVPSSHRNTSGNGGGARMSSNIDTSNAALTSAHNSILANRSKKKSKLKELFNKRKQNHKSSDASTAVSQVPNTDTQLLDQQVELALLREEYNKLLQLHKYSHNNPIVAKICVIVQPILEVVQIGLFINRALFNIFTWQDPILSFWVTVFGMTAVVILHLFPWRLVFGILGIVLVGPQNWIIRVVREKSGYRELDLDTIRKKKKRSKKIEEDDIDIPYFSSIAPDNRPILPSSLDKSTIYPIAVPHSPFKYSTRFYDWPPEPEYARVNPQPAPQSDPMSVAALQVGQFDVFNDDFGEQILGVKQRVFRPKKAKQKLVKQIKHAPKQTINAVKHAPEHLAAGSKAVGKGITKAPKKVVKGTGKVVKGTRKVAKGAVGEVRKIDSKVRDGMHKRASARSGRDFDYGSDSSDNDGFM